MYDIEKEINPNEYYQECKKFYWKYLEIEHELNEFSELKCKNILSYISKYSLDTDYLPVLIHHLNQKELEMMSKIRESSKFVEFSPVSFLSSLVAGQTFNIGIQKLSNFYNSPPTPTSYFDFFVGLSLLEKQSYKFDANRATFIDKVSEICRRQFFKEIPIPFDGNHFVCESSNQYTRLVLHNIYKVLISFEGHRSHDNDYLESTNMTNLFHGRKCSHWIILFFSIKIVYEQLESFGVTIKGVDTVPPLEIRFIGITLGDYCILYFHRPPQILLIKNVENYIRNHSFDTNPNMFFKKLTQKEMHLLISTQLSLKRTFQDRDIFSSSVHPLIFSDEKFIFFNQNILPYMFKHDNNIRDQKILLANVHKFISDSNYIFKPIFASTPSTLAINNMEDLEPFHKCDYSPWKDQGKVVMTTRSNVPAIVIGLNDANSNYAELLTVYGDIETLKLTSYKPILNISRGEVLKIIYVLGLANLSYARIKGVAFDEDKQPRFLIE
ncbi:hypothetical protein G210_1996 [Candida maltosa Xu316]|uniref:Uncharacterized protein n=1 Tax=Candida maltosa (strain Xu316) TaxID=1245528 RepID=M3HJR2_CANMX|nr:hypothetical protein G210_1996 [Candida maltosa Xu316]